MRLMTLRTGLIGLAICLSGGTVFAEEMKYAATLSGAEAVPPVTSGATGKIEASFDSAAKKLSWTTELSGLSGDATAAHFHGPAKPGENAPPALPVALDMLEKGSADVTDAQAEQLASGMWYFNVHTAANPDGEVRGQVMPAK